MTPPLNFDCLNQIFKFVIEIDDNPALLHSFSLVNRIWCQTAIPLLWSNPWKINNKADIHLPLKREKLVKIYFSCLYQESREILIDENFFQNLFLISNEHSSSTQKVKTTKIIIKKDYDDSIINSYIKNRPTFEYAKFLRHLKLNSLAYAIKFWSKSNLSNSRETIHYKIFVEMINYLLIKPTCLFTLDIRYCDGENRQCLRILANLLEKSNVKFKSLVELKTFEYNGNVPELNQIFKALSITSHKIIRMSVYTDILIDNLMNLIKIQENLSEMTITHNSVVPFLYMWNEDEITRTIIEKANLITCLTLEDIYFPPSFLSLFENLKELYLKSFYFPTNNKECLGVLSTIYLGNLQKFHCEPKFPDTTLYLDLISKFIENNSRELSHIIIKGGNIDKPSTTKYLLITMANYCQNLTVYEGPIDSNATNELKEFLISCKNISTLHLHSTNINSDYENFDNLFNVISKIIPKELLILIISDKWIITSNSLETFLKSRENLSSKRKISFYWGSLVNYKGKFRNICSKYQKKGIVEKYGDF